MDGIVSRRSGNAKLLSSGDCWLIVVVVASEWIIGFIQIVMLRLLLASGWHESTGLLLHQAIDLWNASSMTTKVEKREQINYNKQCTDPFAPPSSSCWTIVSRRTIIPRMTNNRAVQLIRQFPDKSDCERDDFSTVERGECPE